MLKINECVEKLESATRALESAPKTGFVDLDMVRQAAVEVSGYLKQLGPRLELGERLIEQTKANLMAKLNVLRSSGITALLTHAEEYLKSDNLDFEGLNQLRDEIDNSLARIFGGYSRNIANQSKTTGDPPKNPGDYR